MITYEMQLENGKQIAKMHLIINSVGTETYFVVCIFMIKHNTQLFSH